MIPPAGCISVVTAVVVFFAVCAVLFSRHKKHQSPPVLSEKLFSARSSVGWFPIGVSLYASCIGSWVLFAPPEFGYSYGWLSVLLYAAGVAIPMMIMSWLGPRVRQIVGEDGFVLSDFVRYRFGRSLHVTVTFITLVSLWSGLAGELTFLGRAASCLSEDVSVPAIVILVTIPTLLYTLYTGLRASIYTDIIQGSLVVVLGTCSLVACLACNDFTASGWNKASSFSKEGALSGSLMLLSFSPAYIIDQGSWQRVWAGQTLRDVKQGFGLSMLLVVPTVICFGAMGIASRSIYPPTEDSEKATTALFYLFDHLGVGWHYVILIMVVSLVVSSVDTLQNAIPAVIATDLLANNLSLNYGRVFSIALNVPAIFVAIFWTRDIIILYLIGNLLATAVLPCVLLGLQDWMTSFGAFLGTTFGILSIFVCGLIFKKGDFAKAVEWYWIPDGPAALSSTLTFFIVPVVSMITGVVTSFIELKYKPELRTGNRILIDGIRGKLDVKDTGIPKSLSGSSVILSYKSEMTLD